MTKEKALVWIRKSEGSNDSVSLELQRDRVPKLAEEVADDYDNLDLGIHTGFSAHVKPPEDDNRLDANEDVLSAVDDLRNGVYDYVCAWDDTRVARDDYFWEIRRAARLGGAEFVFEDDSIPDVDTLTFAVNRTVEQKVKEREMVKAAKARAHRDEQGFDDGRPKYGTCYDSAGEYIVPDEESDEWEAVVTILEARGPHIPDSEQSSYSDLEEKTGASRGTIANVLKRRDWYLDLAEQHDIHVAGGHHALADGGAVGE